MTFYDSPEWETLSSSPEFVELTKRAGNYDFVARAERADIISEAVRAWNRAQPKVQHDDELSDRDIDDILDEAE